MADHEGDDDHFGMNPKTKAYLEKIINEKHSLNSANFPIASRLITEEMTKVQETGRSKADSRYVDVYKQKTIKLAVKVLMPVKEHPRFNFIGKILGPKGSVLKQLQEDTLCRMSVMGRGSMKDKKHEEELRQSLDPKYAHLSDDLHVEITCIAPPAEAHARIAYALAEVRKYLQPDPTSEYQPPMLDAPYEHRAPGPIRQGPQGSAGYRGRGGGGSSRGGRPIGGRPPLMNPSPRQPLMDDTEEYYEEEYDSYRGGGGGSSRGVGGQGGDGYGRGGGDYYEEDYGPPDRGIKSFKVTTPPARFNRSGPYNRQFK